MSRSSAIRATSSRSSSALGVGLAIACAGCNALTGAADLELVDELAIADTSAATFDTGTATFDTGTVPIDTASEASDADAGVCRTSVDCNDNNACTIDGCSTATGMCSHTLIDDDGDGEAASTLGMCGRDCHDSNKQVFSAQTMFFTAPYLKDELPSYDYNCDGVEEKQYAARGSCALVGGICMVTEGWSNLTVPPCGRPANFISKCALIFGECRPANTERVQACR